MRPAFTLPEVLVAILIFAVGILGLAASATFIAMQAGEARATSEAAVLAGRVLDSLRSMPCASVGAGQQALNQAIVRWSASPGIRSVTVDATVELAGRRGTRQWPVNALLPCER